MIPITILILSLVIEAYFIDPFMWKKGWNDKPGSTIVYVFIACVLFWFFSWDVFFLAISCRALFDPILNFSRKKNLCYHPDKKPIDHLSGFKYLSAHFNNEYEGFWRAKTCKQEMIIRAFWFLTGIIVLL